MCSLLIRIPGDVHDQPRVAAYFPSCEDDGVFECVESVLQEMGKRSR